MTIFPSEPDWTKDYGIDWNLTASAELLYDFSKILPASGEAKFLSHILFIASSDGWGKLKLDDIDIMRLDVASPEHPTAQCWMPLKDFSVSASKLTIAGSAYLSGFGWLRIDGKDTLLNRALAKNGAEVLLGGTGVISNSLGSPDQYWETGTTDVDKWKIDLKASYTLTRLAICHQPAYIYGTWKIFYSTDDVAYTELISGTATGARTDSFDNITARYIKGSLSGDGTSTSYWYIGKVFAWA